MPNLIKYNEGDVINGIKVLDDLGTIKIGKRNVRHMGKFLCPICGTEFITSFIYIKNGDTTSCGCYKRKLEKTFSYRHGLSKTRIFRIWLSIRARCHKKGHYGYYKYGERGIRVCDEWYNNFLVFNKWANENGYDEKLQIDRIDNDGNYEPNNCRWVTPLENSNNKRLISRHNTTGYNGVCCLGNGLYLAKVRYNKKTMYQRQFKDPLEAAIERDKYIIENNIPQKLNFPNV